MREECMPQPPIVAPSFGLRKIAPRACVVDKPHLQEFFCEALEEIGFVTCKYDQHADLAALLAEHRPDVLVLGLSAGGVNAAQLLEDFAAHHFDGRVLVVGAPASPMSDAVQAFGAELGLNMLPLLPTPFSDETLRLRLTDILPRQEPPKPAVDVAEACGAEALIRLRHPTWGIVQPGQFLPAEDNSSFRALSEFVITQAISDWRYFLGEYGHVEIAVNLPLSFFEHPNSVERLGTRMPAHPAFEGAIVEMNGTDVVQDTAAAKRAANRLSFYNIADLGTEWPSLLEEAHDFPFAEMEVDQSLITGCADDRLKQSVCRRILEFADQVGTRTVAEGVETRAEFLTVRELGFDVVQGFFLAKPMDARKFARRVLRQADDGKVMLNTLRNRSHAAGT